PVRLDAVLDDVLDDLAPVVASRSALVRRDPLPEVVGDATQLYTVLQNLVSNALKFTPPGRVPEVRVGAEADESAGAPGPDGADGAGWRITVTDNGRGVPAGDRERLFALHARGDRSVQGSGIGLATARRAVEAHGGSIGIDDAPGGGTTVWFTLPPRSPSTSR
ncbi:MAG TPA: HAMP domain-containing sensor histidine kinase, partial [Nocardioides sp.]|nr:HAMP domain-containing sensor histidine kinase [Nocardioides sp.]